MSRLVRSHRMFSEKDRVRFKHVPIGTTFLWHGQKWLKREDHRATVLLADLHHLATGIKPGRSQVILPHKRVWVTRASGIAKTMAAAEKKEQGQ